MYEGPEEDDSEEVQDARENLEETKGAAKQAEADLHHAIAGQEEQKAEEIENSSEESE